GDSIETLKVWKDGKLAPNLIYKLATTPCKNVMERGVCQYDRSVREKFPDDKLLREMRVESYLGTSLLDSRGMAIGILVALDDKPFANADLTITLMNLFADRAAAKIERMDREQELLQLNEQLEARVAERTFDLEEAM